MLARAAALLAASTLVLASATAHAEEQAPEDRAISSIGVGLRPAFIVPGGSLDREKMSSNASVGGGLDAEGIFRFTPTVGLGLTLGTARFASPGDKGMKWSSSTSEMASHHVGLFVERASEKPVGLYGRFGAGYRMVVVENSSGQSWPVSSSSRSSDFHDGIEMVAEGGVAIATSSLRIDPGVQIAVARMWEREGSSSDFLASASVFASFGVRGTFDVVRIERR